MIWFYQKERQTDRKGKKRGREEGEAWEENETKEKGGRKGNGGKSLLSTLPGFTKFRSSIAGEIREARMKSQR